MLIALPDASGVPRLLAVLDGAFPGNRLWPDGIGLVWRDQDGGFHPHRVAGTEVWAFLEAGGDAVECEAPEEPPNPTAPTMGPTDPLPKLLRGVVQDFLKAGKTQATSAEIFAALPPAEQARRTDEQVGVALSGLGLKHRRVRMGGGRPRVYDLLSLNPDNGHGTAWTSGGPVAWTDGEDGSSADQRGPTRWSNDLPSEND